MDVQFSRRLAAVDTSTLASAYSSAVTGSTILLKSGTTFTGTGSCASWTSLCVDKVLTIECEDISTSKCKVDGATARNIFRVSNSKSGTAVFDGLLFQNGSYNSGGAVWVSNSKATFTYCDFKWNTAPVSGGGTNTGKGGALYGEISIVSLTSCLFQSNTVPAGYGGAIYTDNLTNVSFLRVSFADNDPEENTIGKVGQPTYATDSPTTAPSRQPSRAPTPLTPTSPPSQAPTRLPTSQPSQSPTVTGGTRAPTPAHPTSAPSGQPTMATNPPSPEPTPFSPPSTGLPTSAPTASPVSPVPVAPSLAVLPLGAVAGLAAGGGLLVMLFVYLVVKRFWRPPTGGPRRSLPPASPAPKTAAASAAVVDVGGGVYSPSSPQFAVDTRKSSTSFSEKHGMVIKLEGADNLAAARERAASKGSGGWLGSLGSDGGQRRTSGARTPSRLSGGQMVAFTSSKDELL